MRLDAKDYKYIYLFASLRNISLWVVWLTDFISSLSVLNYKKIVLSQQFKNLDKLLKENTLCEYFNILKGRFGTMAKHSNIMLKISQEV